MDREDSFFPKRDYENVDLPDRDVWVQQVYDRAINDKRTQKIEEWPRKAIEDIIVYNLDRIQGYEKWGIANWRRPEISADEAERVKALVIFSGPGTRDKPSKDDYYKDWLWAKWMDRDRGNFAVRLQRAIAELTIDKTPRTANGILESMIVENVRQAKSVAILGPTLIYTGCPDENAAVNADRARPGNIIWQNGVWVIDVTDQHGKVIETPNTLDQIRTLTFPPELQFEAGDIVGIVTHAPHVERVEAFAQQHIAHHPDSLLGQLAAKGVVFHAYPIPTPAVGRQEYAEMEVCGILNYALLRQVAEAKPGLFQ